MEFTPEERSELRYAIRCAAGDPLAAPHALLHLRTAYTKLATADGLPAFLIIARIARPTRLDTTIGAGEAAIRIVKDASRRMIEASAAIDDELAATNTAVADLGDRHATLLSGLTSGGPIAHDVSG